MSKGGKRIGAGRPAGTTKDNKKKEYIMVRCDSELKLKFTAIGGGKKVRELIEKEYKKYI